ncbi:HAD family hydrolase [Spiroplasma clarkii]|uniref:HAD family hydrolase n=1 Tax=Spiroplasma clarkii TaxID=2139 RepID=A0A1Y0L320_9MOLU|nr:HAD hydrolase family protein [Spiroplasma clarkii]ARU92160.1 HAD family hydrolase [Spiroplasma clarkii]ATX71492.1 HAD family hydrolase [Spiroplasma clarkii]
MATKIKLIALDMDGTAYASLGNYVEENIAPINEAIENDIKVIFVTGRPVHAKWNRFEIYNFDENEAIVAGFNGALIYDIMNEKILDAVTIPKAIVEAAFQAIFQYPEAELWGYGQDFKRSFINKPISASKELVHESTFFDGEVLVVKPGDELDDCFKLIMFSGNTTLVQTLRDLGLEVAWNPETFSAEINLKGINKAHALDFLANYYQIDASEMMAIGDAANDIPMLKYAGLSIAPANAIEKVKKLVDEVSPHTNVEGAVAKAIYKHVLEEK